MFHSLRDTATEIVAFLNEIPMVRKCEIYGSLATNTYDELSDIDIEIDVSGYDNGQFMLELVELLKLIAEYREILADMNKVLEIIKKGVFI